VLPQAESRKVLEAWSRRPVNFAQAKQCFVAFVESNWDHAQLRTCRACSRRVAGALRILELPEPPRYLSGARASPQVELVEHRRVPNGQQMDTLADALASLEYYLEAVREQRSGRERILDTTRISLERLGYWPIPEYRPCAATCSRRPAAPAVPVPRPCRPPPRKSVEPTPAAA
jgi:chemosensory pili system protein ChpA (sensor histidine kinase/response regulator)